MLLWRYSLTLPSWEPQEIQAIDYAYLMLGLAHHVFGRAFIAEHNDFARWLARAGAP